MLFGSDTELFNPKFSFPVFPLNTEGIFFNGKNATFSRLKITNFDDAIVLKPSDAKHMFTNCT